MIDRDNLQGRVVRHVVENMDIQTLMTVVQGNIDYYFTELDDDDFISDVKLNYPHLMIDDGDDEDEEEIE